MRLSLFILALSLVLSPCTSQPELISSFDSCTAMNNYYINKVLPLIGPYGLNSRNAYTPTRNPEFAGKPGRPGGPAGLKLYKPFEDPKVIEKGNITEGNSFIDDEDDEEGKEEGKDFSGTNVQVKGVDEADIVKTDGEMVYAISGSKLTVIKVLNEGGGGRVTGTIQLPTRPDDMLLEKNFVVVIGRDRNYKRKVHRRYRRHPSRGEQSTVLYQIRIKNYKPKLISTLHLEGSYVKARETDGVARIVIKFNPLQSIWLYYPNRKYKKDQTLKWNQEIIEYSRAGNWLPTYKLQKGKQTQVGVYGSCSDLYHSPDVFSGFSMLLVVTLPLNKLMTPTSSNSIISDAEALYVTKQSMYVTTNEFQFGNVPNSANRWGPNYQTRIHRFSLSETGATYRASGQITGSVLNRFSMHENDGHFFIASTVGASWWTGRSLSESRVTSFKIDDDKGLLKPVGLVEDLGVGERIFAVRYHKDIAYVVTFRETDPLYIIDLANPKKLEVKGELKIPGFSTYLHRVEDGRVLGVGKDVVNGRTLGTKVSLFDVSDETNPKELSVWTLQGSYSEAEWDNRAFLYWKKLKLAIMPLVIYGRRRTFYGAIVLQITDKKIVEIGRIQHIIPGNRYHPRILRNLVIGKFLWSMSSEQLQINELENIEKKRGAVGIA